MPTGVSCPDCPGEDCNRCGEGTGDTGDTGNTGNETPAPQPQPSPQPAPTPQPAPQPAPAPQPPVDPFQQERQALGEAFTFPVSVMDVDSSNVPDDSGDIHLDEDTVFGLGPMPVGQGQMGGLTEEEWKLAGKAQWQIDVLAGKWPLTNDEIKLLEQAEAQRNRLWKKAVSVSGLTGEERERLRLEFHVRGARSGETPAPTIGRDTIEKWQKAPSPPPYKEPPSTKPVPEPVNPVTAMILKHFLVNQPTNAAEFVGELHTENILDDAPFGNVLAAAKIAVAYKEGGMASARAATADFLVGLIPIPQASFTVEAGRAYANVAFQAQNRFMTDAMKAAGGEFDKEKFWSDFRNDSTESQKALMEWIGYGTD